MWWNRLRNGIFFALLALFWGTSYPAIEVGLQSLPPLLFAALRFDLASVALFGYVFATGRRRWPETRAEWRVIAIGGVFLIGLYFALQFVGQSYVSSAISAVMMSFVPVVTPAFAVPLLRERLSPPAIGGIVIGLLGVVIVADPGGALDGRLIGVFLLFGSAVSFAFGSVLTARFDTALPLSTTQAWVTLVGAGVLHLSSGVLEPSAAAVLAAGPPIDALVALGYLAVAASAALGSINGSTAANTATTGTFTIPLMKENGYPPRVAAAIESVASCGGQVLPPIMGAGAFLMAELIDPTYSEIIVAATLPAILFFLTVAVGVSLNTPTSDIESNVDDGHTVFDQLLNALRSIEYISMFAVLLYFLVVIQSDPMLAGFWSIVTLSGVRLLRNVYEGLTDANSAVDSKVRVFARDTLEGMRRGVDATVDITIILASLGIVVRALIVTGFAQQLSTQMILFASGEVLVLLALAMAASIVFGMGMSTTAAYTLVATLVAPALISVGFEPLVGHFFVFYFAIVSNITPPIALSIVIAQGIADSGFIETTVSAMQIGFPMLLLPYAFVFNSSLLDPSVASLLAFAVVLVGFVAIAAGAAGRVSEALSRPIRVGFVALGLATVFAPMLLAQVALAAAALGGLLYFTANVEGLFAATASRFS